MEAPNNLLGVHGNVIFEAKSEYKGTTNKEYS